MKERRRESCDCHHTVPSAAGHDKQSADRAIARAPEKFWVAPEQDSRRASSDTVRGHVATGEEETRRVGSFLPLLPPRYTNGYTSAVCDGRTAVTKALGAACVIPAGVCVR